jgi:peptidoglycan/xylan/chitin deacetylase (PgdA/CDA1 family)
MRLWSIGKGVVWNLAYLSGLLTLGEKWKHKPEGSGILFYYHRVHPNPGWDPFQLNILPGLFRRQLLLMRKILAFVTLEEFLASLSVKSRPQSPRLASLTFDDGYADVWRYAWPIMKEQKIIPTLFPCTDPLIRNIPLSLDQLVDRVSKDPRKEITVPSEGDKEQRYFLGNWKEKGVFVEETNRFLMSRGREARTRMLERWFGPSPVSGLNDNLYLNLDQAREALKNGVEIGAHSVSHPYLPSLSKEEMAREILECKEELEINLKKEITCFSYPVGRYNEEVKDLVKKAGYRAALATGSRAVRWEGEDCFALPRVSPEAITALGKFYALTSGVRKNWYR